MLTGKTNTRALFNRIMAMMPVSENDGEKYTDSVKEKAEALWNALTLNELVQLGSATDEQLDAIVSNEFYFSTDDGWVYYIPSTVTPQPTTPGIRNFIYEAYYL